MKMTKLEALNLNIFLQRNDKNGKMGISKVTLVLMLVKLGKVAEEFQELQAKVSERIKKDYEGFDGKVERAKAYESALEDGSGKTDDMMTKEQYDEFMQGDFKAVSESLGKALEEEAKKDIDVDYKKFDAQGYSEWMESNAIDGNTGAYWAKYLLEV